MAHDRIGPAADPDEERRQPGLGPLLKVRPAHAEELNRLAGIISARHRSRSIARREPGYLLLGQRQPGLGPHIKLRPDRPAWWVSLAGHSIFQC